MKTRRKTVQTRKSIVFIGGQKAGVSSVLNGILGHPILPSSNAPMTAVAVWIRPADVRVPHLLVSQRLRRALRRATKNRDSPPKESTGTTPAGPRAGDHPMLKSGRVSGKSECRDALRWLNLRASQMLSMGRATAKHLYTAQGDLILQVPGAGFGASGKFQLLELPESYERCGQVTRRLVEATIRQAHMLVAVRNATQLATHADMELAKRFGRLGSEVKKRVVLINQVDRVPPSEAETLAATGWIARSSLRQVDMLECSARTRQLALEIQQATGIDPKTARRQLVKQHPQLALLLSDEALTTPMMQTILDRYTQDSGWTPLSCALGFRRLPDAW